MTDNLAIWNAVSETDPNHTKQVNQRGGFTSISAQYQVMQATKQFGPIGIGWGYVAGLPFFHDTLCFVPVTLWHGNRENTFGPIAGCEEWKDKNGRVDSDASKKATTDAITKLLSQLGFNADVFMGRYDDNKYVARMKEKYSFISEEQRVELMGIMEATGFSVAKFLEVSKIANLKQLPAEKFNGACEWLHNQKKEK